jgi:hypothetical protein
MLGTSLQQNAERQEKDRYDRELFQSMKAHHEQFNPLPRVWPSNSPARTEGIEGGIVRNLSRIPHEWLCLIGRLRSEQKFTKPSETLARKQRYFPQIVTPVSQSAG